MDEKKIIVFENKYIRRVFYKNEWYFSVQDVVTVLTDTVDSKDYLKKMKKRDLWLLNNWGTICPLVEMTAADGKNRKIQAANIKGLFRIIQSIPSPKAEPFKQWLAKVGYERVQEIEDPELGSIRVKELYQAKGYTDQWIEKRMRGIAVRQELTDEWKNRGVQEDVEYSILTAEISKATFGLTPSEYKKLKNLERENLRDHMTDLELIFSMLGEAATTEIARNNDAQGFDENKDSAKRGGKIAGNARKNLEKESGRKVVTNENYLDEPQKKKALEKKKKQ
ncbi:MAG TPA: Bro-N domain-containing protein [bacterium]|nr:Bro-N domain-containing protein [bacterium]HPS28637.1 Bro-N domain-containing protein [bacterium]